MFIHVVLFEIKPSEVAAYRKDSRMWVGYAKKYKGFSGYHTMQRLGYKNQYASVYEWKTRLAHERFMDKFHDWLVSKSKAEVKVLGYFNMSSVDRVR